MKSQVMLIAVGSLALLLFSVVTVQAGTFATIVIDADYSDWVGIPVVDSDPADNVGSVDFAETQIANDNDFLYIRNTFHEAKSLGTFMGIDVDENVASGFDIFGLGLIGQDAGWQNDFPFTSGDGVFNDGQGMSGEFFGSGAALLDQFADSDSRELAISLDILLKEDNSLVFPDDTVKILFWTDQGSSDVSGVINYQLAVPEPTSVALLLLGCGLYCSVRRR